MLLCLAFQNAQGPVFQRTKNFPSVAYQGTKIYLSNSNKFLSRVCSNAEFERKENRADTEDCETY